jgi:hypothetical protein
MGGLSSCCCNLSLNFNYRRAQPPAYCTRKSRGQNCDSAKNILIHPVGPLRHMCVARMVNGKNFGKLCAPANLLLKIVIECL